MLVAASPSPSLPETGASRPSRWNLLRFVALVVVVVPLLAFLAALAQVFTRGIGVVEVASLLGMFVLNTIGVSVGLHRHFAHRAFSAGRPLRVFLAALGGMAAQGPLLFWVATHRRHHAHSDLPGDPHSPNLHGEGGRATWRGFWHSHIGWMFSSEDLGDWVRFARDILQDPWLLWAHQLYPIWVLGGLVLPAAVAFAATGSWTGAFLGFLWGGLVRIFVVNQSSWCVGSVCHILGSRPFPLRDRSANNFWVAIFTFGEGLQNNHHAFPASAHHGFEWWEPDVSARVIGALRKLGLIWDVNVPTPAAIAEAKQARVVLT